MDKAMKEMQNQMNYGLGGGIMASTVAGTDYLCGVSEGFAKDYNNDDGVNIGAGDDIDESYMHMNMNYNKMDNLTDKKFLRSDLSISASVNDLPNNFMIN